MGLVFVLLTGCLASPVVGDWEIRDFQRFELNGASSSTADEQGLMVLGSDSTAEIAFSVGTAEFGTLAWDLAGTWDNEGGGAIGLPVTGDIRFTGRYDNAKALDVEGAFDCRRDGDRMDCDGDLAAPAEADETYVFEIVFGKL